MKSTPQAGKSGKYPYNGLSTEIDEELAELEEQKVLPPLMPFIASKRRKNRRDANETVEQAIAKQLNSNQHFLVFEPVDGDMDARQRLKSDSYSPSLSVNKKRIGSSLCQGPITSSINDDRRNHHQRMTRNGHVRGQARRLESSSPLDGPSRMLPFVEVDYFGGDQGLVKESENHWQPPPAAASNSEIISPRRSIVSTTSDQRESRKRQVTIMEAAEASIGPTVEDDGLLLDEVDEDLGGILMTSLRVRTPGSARFHSAAGSGQPIEMEQAIALKTLLLGQASKIYPEGWVGQAFSLHKNHATLGFGLIQKRGGPCGVLAVVQAFILKHLLFNINDVRGESSLSFTGKNGLDRLSNMTVEQCESALIEALTHILLQARSGNVIVLAVPGLKAHFHGLVGQYKADGVTETLCLRRFDSAESVKMFISQNVHFYKEDGNSSLIAFLCSVMLTRGLARTKEDMDVDGQLMGAHGYCSQEMVHLLLVGSATSNTFDGDKVLSESLVLKGISRRSDIGLLSLFEHYDSIAVGDLLKSPCCPIWLVCSESHFTVLFGLSRGLEETSKAEKTPIDLFYYDQLNRTHEAPIKLTIQVGQELIDPNRSGIVSPIEHCIRTKWRDAIIDWNGTEPLL